MTKKKIARQTRRTKQAPIRAPKPAETKPDYIAIDKARIAAEAPALALTSRYMAANPWQSSATVADIIAYMHDSGCNTDNVLENAVVSHLSELAMLQRMFCGTDNERTHGSDEDKFYYFFEHMRTRLEAAMILDERIKAANAGTVRS